MESSGPPVLSAPYGLKSVTAASSMFCKFWHGWSVHYGRARSGRKQKHNIEIIWTVDLFNLIPPLKSGRGSSCEGAEEGMSRRLKVCRACERLSTRGSGTHQTPASGRGTWKCQRPVVAPRLRAGSSFHTGRMLGGFECAWHHGWEIAEGCLSMSCKIAYWELGQMRDESTKQAAQEYL